MDLQRAVDVRRVIADRLRAAGVHAAGRAGRLRLRIAPLLVLAAAAGAVALPSAASAQTTPAQDCALMGVPAAKTYTIPNTGLSARDPYAGTLARNRLFFDFSVRGTDQDKANVAKISWALDGTVVREDPKAPFQWSGLSGSTRMPAGDHAITVTASLKDGGTSSVDFPLTATDCQPVTFGAEVPKAAGLARFDWDAAFEGADGEPLRSVSATATQNIAATLPARLRGAKIGTLSIVGAQAKSYTLRGGATALSKGNLKVRFVPGSKTFLKITGLPAGTQSVHVKLVHGLVALRNNKGQFRVTGGFTAASGSVTAPAGGRYV
jgi:hypothetical protein